MSLDITWVRPQFPALARELGGRPVAYLDGPAGSQVPRRVIDAVSGYMARGGANTHGAFASSRETDAMIAATRAGVADLLGADDPDPGGFGPNLTTLTFGLSRA